MTQMSMIASTCHCPADYDLALMEMASNSDRRMPQAGKQRRKTGGETIGTGTPTIAPAAQLDTSQVSVPRMRRRAETSPTPTPSIPLSNNRMIQKKPSGLLAQISRPPHSEEKRVEPIASPMLSLGHNVVHPSCAKETVSHEVTSPAPISEQPQGQVLQIAEVVRLREESHPVLVKIKPTPTRQPAENTSVRLASNVEQTQNQTSHGAGAAPKTPTPTLARNQSPSRPALPHNNSGPFTENAKTTVQPLQPPPPLTEEQSEPKSATNRSFTAQRKQIDHSTSHEKIWVGPSKDVKRDEWLPPHIDLNTLLDLKRLDLVTEERKSPFAAASYDEVPKLDNERTNSTGPRSPTLSSESASSLPRTPHTERDNYPEVAPVQSNQTSRLPPRRIDAIASESFPETLHALQNRETGATSIGSDGSDQSRFVSIGANPKSKKWGGLFKSNRTTTATSTPQAVFSASGKCLILWNEVGAGCYDLHNADSIQFRRINAHDVRLAASGTAHLAVVTRTSVVNPPISRASYFFFKKD